MDYSLSIPDTISMILVLGAIGLPAIALFFRGQAQKGLGWPFIRYSVIVTTIPLVGVLAMQEALSAVAATILGTALGYTFGHTEGESEETEDHKSSKTNSN